MKVDTDNENRSENSVLPKVVDWQTLHNSVFRFEKDKSSMSSSV